MSENQKQQAVVEQIIGSRTATTVPFSALVESPFNVRRREPQNVEGMAQAIRSAGGILQNLIVHEVKAKRGNKVSYGVAAGRRRKAGYGLLVDLGEASAEAPINVVIVTDGEARLMSLMENTEREEMHLADVCEAIRDLHAEGRTIEHIAEVFSISVLTVQRRLKLVHLSPVLFEAFRNDEIDLGQLQALALCPDPAEQERIWTRAKAGPEWGRTAQNLRTIITSEEVSSASRMARFVGLQDYEAAGGDVRRDLFAEDGAGYLINVELLHELGRAKLEQAADALRADGWSWVEANPDLDHKTLYACTRLPATRRKPTKAEKKERAELAERATKASDALNEAMESDDEDIDTDALEQALQEAEEAVERYDERFEGWSPEQKAVSGVLVSLSQSGDLAREYGLVKRSNLKTAGKALGDEAPPALRRAAQQPERQKPLHSESLCERLTAHRTAILRHELSRRPEIALVTLLARMVPAALPGHFGRDTRDMLNIVSIHSAEKMAGAADDMTDSPAWKAYAERTKYWQKRIDGEAKGDLFGWLLGQDGETLRDLFAFCVAGTVDSITSFDRPHNIERVAQALNVDYRVYWKATAASYFQHVPKARILDVVKEATSAETAAPLEKLKKQELIAAAERAVSETGWLPEPLRHRDLSESMQNDDLGDNPEETESADLEEMETDAE
ncbi:parB-like nuclease domain protein (plasmid) [Burkholderia gladioli]|uniref:ParB-like nuclease domain protein n=1 Tax=Burkholderia gladioli TaxID=28095 RepID=A0AAW3FCS0_BURGA|nr:ParB/Srx family N-terminal domain-containing protein [Burkholderia gladioli]AJW93639.1 parB-like nuclease domain protein [Burkholderia gladioli]KGC24062.1 parB-like nuclease domain protein [Burkholderia gladioli]